MTEWIAIFGGLALLLTATAGLIVYGVARRKHRETCRPGPYSAPCCGIGLDHSFRLTAAVTAGVLAVGLIVSMITVAVADAACQRMGRELGTGADWELIGGCYIQVGDRWMPSSVLAPVVEDGRIQLEIEMP